MNKTATIVIIVLILGLGVWALARKDDTMSDMSNDTNTSEQMPVDSTPTTPTDTTGTSTGINVGTDVSVGTVKTFTITASNYAFSPTTMTVNKGDKVRITLKNTQGSHDIKVDGYDVKSKLLNGVGEDTIEFTADKSGTFEFYCTFGNHRAMGMKGMLTVK